MSAASVLVLLTAADGAAAALQAATAAAVSLGSPGIEVLHVRLDPVRTILPSEEVLTPARISAVEAASAVESAATYDAFRAWHTADQAAGQTTGLTAGLTAGQTTGQTADRQGQWTEVVGEPADEIAQRGKRAALVVLTLPRPHAPLAERAALEAAVFATGRPVLAVPADWHGSFGAHLAVGWHDTPATRHALTALRPWLLAAKTVTALTIGAALPADGPLAGLPGRLDQRTVTQGGQSDGAALLAAAAASGADALAMGAYRRGRILEWALGGVTEYALHHATLPLLLMH